MLIVILLVVASFFSLGYLSQQASRELDAELHNELNADKDLVRSSVRWNSRCTAAVRRSCKIGDTLPLYDRKGGVFIDQTGNTKIGKWNVRLACDRDKKLGRVYHVQVARKAQDGEFLEDPLTKHTLEWSSLFPMRESCEGGVSKTDVVLRNDCYGNLTGRDPVPADLLPHCPGCPGSANFYCSDDQVSFPACPSGYRVGIRYIDRFGWGGVDLTKITVCKKV